MTYVVWYEIFRQSVNNGTRFARAKRLSRRFLMIGSPAEVVAVVGAGVVTCVEGDVSGAYSLSPAMLTTTTARANILVVLPKQHVGASSSSLITTGPSSSRSSH